MSGWYIWGKSGMRNVENGSFGQCGCLLNGRCIRDLAEEAASYRGGG